MGGDINYVWVMENTTLNLPLFLHLFGSTQKEVDGSVLSNSYTMGWPPVRGDNPRALASGLSYVQAEKHGITILYHLHQSRPCTS